MEEDGLALSSCALSHLLSGFLGCCLVKGWLSEDKQHGADGWKAFCGLKLSSERFPSHNLSTPCIFSTSVQRKRSSLGKPPNLCLQSQPLQMKAICNEKRNQSVHFYALEIQQSPGREEGLGFSKTTALCLHKIPQVTWNFKSIKWEPWHVFEKKNVVIFTAECCCVVITESKAMSKNPSCSSLPLALLASHWAGMFT